MSWNRGCKGRSTTTPVLPVRLFWKFGFGTKIPRPSVGMMLNNVPRNFKRNPVVCAMNALGGTGSL